MFNIDRVFNIKNKNKNKNRSKKLLNDLKKHKTVLTISNSKNQFTGEILDVLPKSEQFLFELINAEGRHSYSLESNELTFFGELHGQYIEFRCGNIEEQKMQSLPVLAAAIPEQITVTQRRESYRFKFPESTECFCSGKLANGSSFQFKLADISNGGLALYFDNKKLFPIKKDEIIRDAVVDLNSFGKHFFDLKYIQTMERKGFNKNATMTSKWLLSFQFEDLEALKAKDLAKIMTDLQQDQIAKSERFRSLV